MPDFTFRLAAGDDRPAIIHFMNTHWGEKHPAINLPDFFDFYYQNPDGSLRFALAETGGEMAALAGFIPANQNPVPDIWVSLWIADKRHKGIGLELMAALPKLTGCRTLACNNIRPETRPFYEFLGYTTGRVGHFYRLAEKAAYAIAQPAHTHILPAGGSARLIALPTEADFLASGFIPPKNANPYKDNGYIARRYYHFPRQIYNVWGAYLPGQNAPAALLVTRTTPALGSAALRIVDYVGTAEILPELGDAINTLLKAEDAEYADLYCAGIPPEILQKAGFHERSETDSTIIPNYLTPPALKNIEYYYFTNQPQNFTLFRADGDQDRPNTPV